LLSSCEVPSAGQPAGSPADPELEAGAGGILTEDLTSRGRTIRIYPSDAKKGYEMTNGTGSEVVVRFVPDDSVPAGTDLSGIETIVCELVSMEVWDEYSTGYSFNDAFLCVTDETGTARFNRPTEICLLDVEYNTLPNGVGVRGAIAANLKAEDTVREYTLTASGAAQLCLGNHTDDVQIELLGEDGVGVFAAYTYTPVYTRRASASDVVEISGTVKVGGMELEVFETMDLSGEEEYDKLKMLERIDLVTREEQKLLDSFNHHF